MLQRSGRQFFHMVKVTFDDHFYFLMAQYPIGF